MHVVDYQAGSTLLPYSTAEIVTWYAIFVSFSVAHHLSGRRLMAKTLSFCTEIRVNFTKLLSASQERHLRSQSFPAMSNPSSKASEVTLLPCSIRRPVNRLYLSGQLSCCTSLIARMPTRGGCYTLQPPVVMPPSARKILSLSKGGICCVPLPSGEVRSR